VIRFLVKLGILALLIWAAFTIPLGDKTLVGHVRAIWHSSEAEDLKNGVKQSARPAAEKIKRGIEAGYHAMTTDAPPAGSAVSPERH
jgi:hypothetical protein